LLIVLIAWQFSKDSQFPPQDEDSLEAVKFTSLWAVNDPERITKSKFFWILVKMDLCIVISQRPRFSPTLFE